MWRGLCCAVFLCLFVIFRVLWLSMLCFFLSSAFTCLLLFCLCVLLLLRFFAPLLFRFSACLLRFSVPPLFCFSSVPSAFLRVSAYRLLFFLLLKLASSIILPAEPGFKICDEPDSPNERACLRYVMTRNRQMRGRDPESPNEGACLRYMMTRKRLRGGRV